MSTQLKVQCKVHFDRATRGRKEIREGDAPPSPAPGRVPRVARLLALAHRFERLLREGAVKDYAELARLGHVTRARVSQIMNLTLLAPDIQEAVLFLPLTERGRDPIRLDMLQGIALTLSWESQRALWKTLFTKLSHSGSKFGAE